MSGREQKVELIQQRLMKKLGETKGEEIRISVEDAVHIVFMLDIIRVTVRKMEEIMN